MTDISAGEVGGQIDELLDRIERGEVVRIVRDGRLAASLEPIRSEDIEPREALDVESLIRFVESMPPSEGDAVRQLRDEARY